ncbi:hypothetical protein [Cellulosimicrobium marinum]|uniref:hypothetical protein n=1 Tax=Cellulosimicrobium marinum TaxID=1638992 RepID=UPI001E497380|nr:hypothetical protein [Cellulosimicrobium marinum]MCB7137424.1 hypothetical protein [Cellulosimicrobium marinum]
MTDGARSRSGTGGGGAPGRVGRGRVLRLGVARDTAATRHLVTFLVVAVATVLVTRFLLAASGYPQVGGGELHVAHVLWGGLGMALGIVVLLSFVGPTLRSLGAVLSGVGFGLFVDEIGKFVTADNDYFYEPTAALVYATVVVLVLVVEALHGRRRHHPAEYLAVATDRAVAGVAGGFTDEARDEARALVDLGRGQPTAEEVAALVEAVPRDDADVPDPVRALVRRSSAGFRSVLERRWAGVVVVVAVLGTAVGSLAAGVRVLVGGIDVPSWVGWGIVVGVAATTACVVVGVLRARGGGARGPSARGDGSGDRRAAAVWVRRGVLVSLLLTQLLVFRALQWVGVAGLVVDLLVLAALGAALGRDDERRHTGP